MSTNPSLGVVAAVKKALEQAEYWEYPERADYGWIEYLTDPKDDTARALRSLSLRCSSSDDRDFFIMSQCRHKNPLMRQLYRRGVWS